jgi:hypothetical protein
MHAWRFALLSVVASGLTACGSAGTESSQPTTPASQAVAPAFSVAGGTYTAAQTVTISTTTAGAAIYYTTDGSTPTTSSTAYSIPVNIAASMTLKAITTAAGYTASSVTSAAYTINLGSSSDGGNDLPTPPGGGVPKPSGAVGGLKVLDWAGFKAAITYTFDDSLPSQIANYSLLQATGERMTFFLIGASDQSSPVWAQAAKDGHELGNHTQHHCYADGTGCGIGAWAGSVEAEYDLCTERIEQNYGVSSVWTTAAPYGDTGYEAVAKTRFFLNRGVWGGQIAPNGDTDPYNLPIYGAAAGDTASIFNSYIDTAHSSGKWQIFLFHSLGGDGGYAPVNVDDVLASINHAKSAGDIWIDSMVNVGAYWAGQKAVTNAAAAQSGSGTLVTWTLPSHFPPGKYVRVTVTGGTLKQGGVELPWNDAGYYEVALDPGSLTIAP